MTPGDESVPAYTGFKNTMGAAITPKTDKTKPHALTLSAVRQQYKLQNHATISNLTTNLCLKLILWSVGARL